MQSTNLLQYLGIGLETGAFGMLAMVVGHSVLVLIFQWLWNRTTPQIFNVPAIGFWQSVCLVLMVGILSGQYYIKVGL
jgi:hypothetical protein